MAVCVCVCVYIRGVVRRRGASMMMTTTVDVDVDARDAALDDARDRAHARRTPRTRATHDVCPAHSPHTRDADRRDVDDRRRARPR